MVISVQVTSCPVLIETTGMVFAGALSEIETAARDNRVETTSIPGEKYNRIWQCMGGGMSRVFVQRHGKEEFRQ
ncbi:hypothetical protein DRQ21_09735 [Candidatus Fermentibacteria bacterium]|nr:MAG: hypothetical protein DRQ21_09735 [Candidatus Fermentibacteria bacterium]